MIKYTGKKYRILYFPMKDFGVRTDSDTVQFVSYLAQLVRNGEVLYIHCMGGHGRTGTISIQLMT